MIKNFNKSVKKSSQTKKFVFIIRDSTVKKIAGYLLISTSKGC